MTYWRLEIEPIDHEGPGTRAKMVSSHNDNSLWLWLTWLWKIHWKGGFTGKIIYKWAIFHSYVKLPEVILVHVWRTLYPWSFSPKSLGFLDVHRKSLGFLEVHAPKIWSFTGFDSSPVLFLGCAKKAPRSPSIFELHFCHAGQGFG